MKNESVRIKASKMEKLRMLSDLTGHSVNWMVDRAVDLFLAQEAPVMEAVARETRKKLEGKRQAVISAEVAYPGGPRIRGAGFGSTRLLS